MSDRSLTVSIGGLILLFVGLIVAINISIKSQRCSSIGSLTKKPTEFHLLAGCMIKVKEEWVPLKSWRTVD